MVANKKQELSPEQETAEKAELEKAAAQQAAAEKAAADKKTKKSIEAAQDGSNLLPKQRERHLFHVELDKSAFSPSTGKKLSQAFVQMFGVKEFSEKELVRLGYTVKVLWNPTKYVK